MDATAPVVADLEVIVDVAEQGIVSKAVVENVHQDHPLHLGGETERAHGQRARRHPRVARRGHRVTGGEEHEVSPGMLYSDMLAEPKHAVVARGDPDFGHDVPHLRAAAGARLRLAGPRPGLPAGPLTDAPAPG